MTPVALAPVSFLFRRILVWPMCALFLVLFCAGTATAASGTPPAGTGTPDQIAAAQQELFQAKQELKDLTNELARVQAAQPHLPPKATDAQRQQYKADLAAWKQKIADLNVKIVAARSKVAAAQDKLYKLTGKPPPPQL
jgi:septal ring factor EnvC (AmiA/AmiB activator)